MKIKIEDFFYILTAIIIFVFFFHTLNYPWNHFDKQIIDGAVYPMALSFSQIFDYISSFGINNHFEASNPFYSEIANLRSDPINTLITLFVFFFLQKNVLYYHLLSLTLHIASSVLLFLILNKVSSDYIKDSKDCLRLLLVSALTLTWSLNPLNIESILFTVNWAAVLTYFLCTFIFYYFICVESTKNYLLCFIFTFLLFLIPLFNSEYSITLPIILFFYIYASTRFKTPSLSLLEAIKVSFKKTAPLFAGLLLFVSHFLFSPTKENIINTASASASLNLQRIFWFSPQIFFHYIKLILLPMHLSIDQTIMVRFSKTLFGYYAAFCSLFMYVLILILFISLINIRRRPFYLLFTCFSYFLIALLPFLHLISPSYCIASERYLYFPLLMLIFGLSHLLFHLFSNISSLNIKIVFISLVTLITMSLGTRAYLRTLDWKDSVSLFGSSIKETPSALFKALRLQFIGTILSESTKDEASKNKALNYINNSINILQDYMNALESEKEIYEDDLPDILVTYGLDPKTLQAKAVYLLSFTKMGLFNDPDGAYNLLEPYMKDYSVLDTQILDLYLGLLFRRNELDKAEKILNYALKRKISPTVLIALSELYKLKYGDEEKSEYYLKKSFEYFPYDSQTLLYLKGFYMYMKNAREFGRFSYLYGIRTHSPESLKDAYVIFNHLDDKIMANKAMQNLKLLEKIE